MAVIDSLTAVRVFVEACKDELDNVFELVDSKRALLATCREIIGDSYSEEFDDVLDLLDNVDDARRSIRNAYFALCKAIKLASNL